MHLEITVNHNSNSIRVDLSKDHRKVIKGQCLPCDRTNNTVRILHEIFNKLTEGGLLSPDDLDNSIQITGIDEDTIRNEGEW